MTVRVEVPEGCRGIDFPGGSKANGSGDGLVRVSDAQAAYLRSFPNGVKILGTSVAGFAAGPWVECADCGRSFLRSLDDPDQKRCPKHRDG